MAEPQQQTERRGFVSDGDLKGLKDSENANKDEQEPDRENRGDAGATSSPAPCAADDVSSVVQSDDEDWNNLLGIGTSRLQGSRPPIGPSHSSSRNTPLPPPTSSSSLSSSGHLRSRSLDHNWEGVVPQSASSEESLRTASTSSLIVESATTILTSLSSSSARGVEGSHSSASSAPPSSTSQRLSELKVSREDDLTGGKRNITLKTSISNLDNVPQTSPVLRRRSVAGGADPADSPAPYSRGGISGGIGSSSSNSHVSGSWSGNGSVLGPRHHKTHTSVEHTKPSEVGDFKSEIREATLSRFTLASYLNEELYGQSTAQQHRDFGREVEAVYNFIRVPAQLEHLLGFGVLVCIDSFLFLMTFMPLRLAMTLVVFSFNILSSLIGVISFGMLQPLNHPRWKNFCTTTPTQRWDAVRCAIIAVVVVGLLSVDTSILYHFIRGQSTMKLYVIFNCLEVLDKLCCSFGHDIFDTLLWTTTATRAQRNETSTSMHPVFLTLVALCYTMVHSLVLFSLLVTLNVAINSHNNSLLTLLVSNQFVELKGGVFKKIEAAGLFQICCSDIVERFQIGIFLLLMALLNFDFLEWQLGPHWRQLLASFLGVFASEVLVDWVKHAFITRFNRIPLTTFQTFKLTLIRDVTPRYETDTQAGEAEQGSRLPYALGDVETIGRRIGFVPLPLFCVCLRVFSRVHWPPQLLSYSLVTRLSLVLALYLMLCAVKVALRARLVRRALREHRLARLAFPNPADTGHVTPRPLPDRFERIG